MKERPIIFSSAMVRAILEGRKTQTRRVIKPQPTVTEELLRQRGAWIAGESLSDQVNAAWQHGFVDVSCPYGQPGDRLWVRETWGCKAADRPGVPGGRKPQPGDSIQYAENGADAWQWRVPGSLPWRPSIHMPRWASRILLEITDVRVQLVQDISEEDARSEGVLWVPGHGEITPADLHEGYSNYLDCRQGFQVLWDSINAKRGFGWDANPWVWALTFKRVEDGELE